MERGEEYLAYMDGHLARPGQTLTAHSEQVARFARSFGEKCGLGRLAQSCGMLHDFGKALSSFQNYLNNGGAGVPHSIWGARQACEDFASFAPAAEMVAGIIAAHHGKLHDALSPGGETPLLDKLFEENSLLPPTAVQKADAAALKAEIDAVLAAMPDSFALSMLTKLLYSCLVDADRLDAYLAESGQSYAPCEPDWDGLLARLEQHLAALGGDTDMARLRRQVSASCAESGRLCKGIYKLEVPTGGGKTLSSLRFALEHARRHKLDRIIYVIPYLSILNQTADDIRDALGVDEDILLEHHSGFLTDPEKAANYKLHTDRWDAPIVLTTQVQFLESVFSARGSDLRKLHNMARSVLVFDEAQSLPVKCVHLFNGAANYLQRVMGSTLLLCTATQPLLDKVVRPITFTKSSSIAPCPSPPERYRLVNRLVPGGYSYPDLAAFVLDKHKSSTLVIVNTKAAAKRLVEALQEAGVTALHLSTSMCGAHRGAVLAKLFGHLERHEPVLCVSTQLIEAGVNISFECVIRELAGLDSIYQAAGRCNRHGEFGEVKNVYIVNIARANLTRLPDIEEGAKISHRLLNDKTVDIHNAIDTYYEYYFHARSGAMEYPLPSGGTLYDMLSVNKRGQNNYAARKHPPGTRLPALVSAIRSAADEFYVIDRGRTEVVAPYDEGEQLASRFLASRDIDERRRLLRELRPYGVSLYQYQVDELRRHHALDEGGEIVLLARGFYHEHFGVDLAGSHEFLCIC